MRLWKVELQKLADELGVSITVRRLLPGTSKWNKIEHRLFSFITGNWRGKPLVSYQVIVQLIAATTTKTSLEANSTRRLTPWCQGLRRRTRKHQHFRHDFRGECNYTISPKAKTLQQ